MKLEKVVYCPLLLIKILVLWSESSGEPVRSRDFLEVRQKKHTRPETTDFLACPCNAALHSLGQKCRHWEALAPLSNLTLNSLDL